MILSVCVHGVQLLRHYVRAVFHDRVSDVAGTFELQEPLGLKCQLCIVQQPELL